MSTGRGESSNLYSKQRKNLCIFNLLLLNIPGLLFKQPDTFHHAMNLIGSAIVLIF